MAKLNCYCMSSIAVIGCALLLQFLLVLHTLYDGSIQFKRISNWKDVKPYRERIVIIASLQEFPYQNISCRLPSTDAYYGYIFEISARYEGEFGYAFFPFYCKEAYDSAVLYLTNSLIQSIGISIRNASLEELQFLNDKIKSGNATYNKFVDSDVFWILHKL